MKGNKGDWMATGGRWREIKVIEWLLEVDEDKWRLLEVDEGQWKLLEEDKGEWRLHEVDEAK